MRPIKNPAPKVATSPRLAALQANSKGKARITPPAVKPVMRAVAKQPQVQPQPEIKIAKWPFARSSETITVSDWPKVFKKIRDKAIKELDIELEGAHNTIHDLLNQIDALKAESATDKAKLAKINEALAGS